MSTVGPGVLSKERHTRAGVAPQSSRWVGTPAGSGILKRLLRYRWPLELLAFALSWLLGVAALAGLAKITASIPTPDPYTLGRSGRGLDTVMDARRVWVGRDCCREAP